MLIKNDTTSSGTTTPTSSMNNLGITNNTTSTKKRYTKKPDPSAPKITRPCTECGKKFWSWKALFGHMRCHPERQWRGINPPTNINNRYNKEKTSTSTVTSTVRSSYGFLKMTEDDHDAASTLLMFSNCFHQVPGITTSENVVSVREGVVVSGGGGDVEVVPGSLVCGGSNFRFECTSCKKVFGSPQALGGHRASHKNVKGCFANTRNGDGLFLKEELSSGSLQNCDDVGIVVEDDKDKMLMLGLGLSSGFNSGVQLPQYHQCNLCLRDFPTGQSLGGHKRCHFEKWDNNNNKNHTESFGINWDLPAPTPVPATPQIFEGGSSSCLHSMSLERLELRLGL